MSAMPPPPPPPPPGGGIISGPPSYGAPPPGYTPYTGGTGAAMSNYASFGARLLALIIDGLVGALFEIPGAIAFFAGPRHYVSCTVNGDPGLCRFPTASTIALGALLWAAGLIIFLVLYCKKVSRGQSWGHGVANIRIVDANTGSTLSAGRVFGRQVARIISGWICYLGYLWMLWDPRKQTWHDKIVSSVVVKA